MDVGDFAGDAGKYRLEFVKTAERGLVIRLHAVQFGRAMGNLIVLRGQTGDAVKIGGRGQKGPQDTSGDDSGDEQLVDGTKPKATDSSLIAHEDLAFGENACR